MSIEQNLLINIVDQILLLDENFSPNGTLILIDKEKIRIIFCRFKCNAII